MSWNELRKGRYSQSNVEYFITFNTQNRLPIFKNHQLARLFCQKIKNNEIKHHCQWLTWVLMPDHFHGLLQLDEQSSSLASVIGGLKGNTAHIINKFLHRNGKLWQPSFYDHALRFETNRKQVARYIVANPLRKNLVKRIENYPYWNSVYL